RRRRWRIRASPGRQACEKATVPYGKRLFASCSGPLPGPGIRTVPCADRLLSPKPPFACMPPKLARFMQGSFVLEHNASLAREQKPSDSFEPDAGLLCQPKTHGKEDVPR